MPKALAGIAAALVCALLYAVPSALTLDRATTIAPFAWEEAIPFLPHTVWAYLAQYPLLLVAYFGTREAARCRRFLVAVVAVQATAALAFLAWPLRYPREAHALPPGLDAWTQALAGFVHRIDAPVNCFPSLHVTSCLLCFWLVPQRGLKALVAVVGLASIASTLTFKQHYAIDLLAAVPLAALAWWWAGGERASRPPHPASPAPASAMGPTESPHDRPAGAARG